MPAAEELPDEIPYGTNTLYIGGCTGASRYA
jgi:hypothetical protein